MAPQPAAAPRLGCPVIYGVSENDVSWWDNSHVAWLGWRPKDNSAAFRDEVYASKPLPARDAPEALYQGGRFAIQPIHEK